MANKKILIISKFFHPDITPRSFRTTELAKELARKGHEVSVWLPDKGIDYTAFEREHKLNIHYMEKIRWRKIYTTGKLPLLKRGFSRAAQLLFEYPDIELMFMVNKALRSLAGKPIFDLLISIAVPYPIHWGVALARSKKRPLAKTWVADCGDPYMGERQDTFRRLFYFKYVEKWFMRKADFISIPVKSSVVAYYPEFHSKIRIIPQGFKIEPLPKTGHFKSRNIPHFAYAGNFNLKNRDPRPLLENLSALENDFKFFIFTNRRDLLEPYTKRLKNKLVVSDLIPREELLRKLSEMDFLINFDNNSAIQTPSKLIDYKICDRPVLNIAKKLNEDNVLHFLNGDYTHAMPLGNTDDYRIENVCAAFLKLTNDLSD